MYTFLSQASDPLEIKSRIIRLEQALKQEGLFKNVKGDFMLIKKEIIGVSSGFINVLHFCT